jgi:cytochrome o ubiquinol oxidase operon protein cyoD
LTAHHSSTATHSSKSALWSGSILSIFLTVVPFWLVMTGYLQSATATTVAIFLLAMVQIVVHVRYFLHIDSRTEGGWTLLAFVFTAIILVITIIGSIWVMYHLNANMMPMGSDGM